MSLGITDKYYWQELLNWLKTDNSRLLILHDYKITYTENGWASPRRINQNLLKTRLDFIKSADVPLENYQNIIDQIIPIYGDTFFKYGQPIPSHQKVLYSK